MLCALCSGLQVAFNVTSLLAYVSMLLQRVFFVTYAFSESFDPSAPSSSSSLAERTRSNVWGFTDRRTAFARLSCCACRPAVRAQVPGEHARPHLPPHAGMSLAFDLTT